MKRQNGFRRGFTLIELLACQPKPWRRQARAAFTLIELLVVIAIIGSLAAILIPSINKARGAALRARALGQIQDLDSAIKRFFEEYGRMPMPQGMKFTASIRDISCTTEEQAQIIQVLLNKDDWNTDKQNKRQIVFLDLDPGSFRDPDGEPCKTEDQMILSLLSNGYQDPWGTPYGILLDLTLDDKIEVPPYGTAENPVRAKCGVYSYGDKKDTSVDIPPLKTW